MKCTSLFICVLLAFGTILTAGCGKKEEPKTFNGAMNELNKIKEEEGVAGMEITEEQAKAQIEAARKEFEEQKKKSR